MSKEPALPPAITRAIDALVAATGSKGWSSEQIAEGLVPFLREHPDAMRRLGMSADPAVLLRLAAIIAVDEWHRTHVENYQHSPSLMTRVLQHNRWPKRRSGDFDEDD